MASPTSQPTGLIKPKTGPGSRTGTRGPYHRTSTTDMALDDPTNTHVPPTTINMDLYDVLHTTKTDHEAKKSHHEAIKAKHNNHHILASPTDAPRDRRLEVLVLELEETLAAERRENLAHRAKTAREMDALGRMVGRMARDLERACGGVGCGGRGVGERAYWERSLPRDGGVDFVAVAVAVAGGEGEGDNEEVAAAADEDDDDDDDDDEDGDGEDDEPANQGSEKYWAKRAVVLPQYHGEYVVSGRGEEDGRGDVTDKELPEEYPVSNMRGV